MSRIYKQVLKKYLFESAIIRFIRFIKSFRLPEYKMHNWSVDEKTFKKLDPEGYKIWRIQQLINYGLDGEKLSRREVKKYWHKLYLDPLKKKFLEFLLWPKKR